MLNNHEWNLFKKMNLKGIIDSLQLLSIAFFLFTIQIWQLHGFGRFSIIFFWGWILLSILYSIGAMKSPVVGQLFYNSILDMLLKLFFLLILLSSFSEILNYLGTIYSSIICISLIVMIVFHILHIIRVIQNSITLKTYRWYADKKDFCLSVFFLTFLLFIELQFINLWPRWDSASYFLSFEKLSVMNIFQNGMDGLIVCGHPASAYALLILLLRTIPGISHLNALYLLNFFLIILDFILINCIFRKLFIGKNSCIYTILAFIFICSPYILGNIANINPEYTCFTGFLIYLFGITSSNSYVCVLGCYMVCYSREIGVPIIALLIFVQLVYELCNAKKGKRILFSSIQWIYYLISFAVGCIWLFSYIQGNWSENMGLEWEHFYADGTPMYRIHVSTLYIGNQLRGIFLTNFTWVYAIAIFTAGVYFISKHKKNFIKHLFKNQMCITILSGIIISTIVMCLFLTHHNYRYYTLIVLFIQILGIWSVIYITSSVIQNYAVQIVPMLMIGIVLFVQCYTTIDPIMLSIFPTINTGNAKIAIMPWRIKDLPDTQFLECARYNLQISYFDKALDIVYYELEQEAENSKVFIYDGYQWGTEGDTLNSIWGHGYEYQNPPLWGIWNQNGQYRELSYNPSYIINPIPISNYTEIDQYSQEADALFYLELPWGDELISQLKESCLDIKLFKTIKYHGWIFHLYSFNGND